MVKRCGAEKEEEAGKVGSLATGNEEVEIARLAVRME
jgi:hypothetical protein